MCEIQITSTDYVTVSNRNVFFSYKCPDIKKIDKDLLVLYEYHWYIHLHSNLGLEQMNIIM